MSKHSDLYNQVREEIARWPQWKINAYNEMIATSAHAEKVTPHTPTNADAIRSMSDEDLSVWLVDETVCERVCKMDEYCHGDECVERVTEWLKQPAKEDEP